MGVVKPSFPDQIWDGLTANPDRYELAVTVDPNSQDWDRIAAEVVAIQQYILGLPVTPDGDKFSLYSAEAEVIIPGGRWVLIQPSGGLKFANSSISGSVSGLSVTGGSIGSTVVYLRQGRIVSADWTTTTGGAALTPGADYFLTVDGGMSITAPATGFVAKLGQAQNTTTFDIDINPSIKI